MNKQNLNLIMYIVKCIINIWLLNSQIMRVRSENNFIHSNLYQTFYQTP